MDVEPIYNQQNVLIGYQSSEITPIRVSGLLDSDLDWLVQYNSSGRYASIQTHEWPETLFPDGSEDFEMNRVLFKLRYG